MIKTNIKLRVTPEQSEAVQKICFANNIGWGRELELNFLDSPCLFIDQHRLSYSPNIRFYNEQEEEEIDADLFIRTNGTCVELIEECQFAKYGFEKPDLKQIGSWLIGYIKNGNQAPIPCMWFLHDGSCNIQRCNLTPIKKPWYETCKFPCLIMADYCMPVVVKHYNEGFVYDFRDNRYCVKSWRLLTNDEIEGLKQ